MSGVGASMEPLLQARNLVQCFPMGGHGSTKGALLHALRGVSLDIGKGETLGVVGESGSGKTTLARALLQAPRPLSGSVQFRGHDLTKLRGAALLQQRRYMQLVFQDPFGSLDPTWRVADIVEEPLVGYELGLRKERLRRVSEVLELVGLPVAAYGRRRPRELSGGQCQRVAIARALAPQPALVICDEAVSALDVLIQAQLLALFEQLRSELGLAYVFISHDLAQVRQVSDRIAVLYLGQLCEVGPASAVYRAPRHPYTEILLASVPKSEPFVGHHTVQAATVEPSSDGGSTSGCSFRLRCPRAQERCALEEPKLRSIEDGRFVACHFPAADAASVRPISIFEKRPGPRQMSVIAGAASTSASSSRSEPRL